MPDPDYNPRKVGAVVIFPEGMTEFEVREALWKFNGTLPPKQRVESIETGSFDPDWGSPVFYVP